MTRMPKGQRPGRRANPTAREERRHGGELHVACPNCGAEPRGSKTHFSVSRRGGHCFVCSWGTQNLQHIAQRMGLLDDGAVPEIHERERLPFLPQRKGTPRWLREAEKFISRAVAHPESSRRWAQYKVLPDAVRLAHRLGYGIFPRYSSRCVYPRLIVPMLSGDRIVGARGRVLDRQSCEWHDAGVCTAGGERRDCATWMSTSLVPGSIPLFNGARLARLSSLAELAEMRLGPALPRDSARTLLIMENPIDALMYEVAYPDVDAVATFSVSYWVEAWESLIASAGYNQVVVFYDNDVPGNGNTPQAWDEWRRAHQRDIVPGGVRLVNRLLAADVPAMLYPWGDAPAGADPGWLLVWGA